MNRLRLWVAASVAWLLFFYNIEKVYDPINIASFVYVLAAIVAALVVMVRPLHRVTLAQIIAVTIAALLVLKYFLGYPILSLGLPLTVTEIVALVVTAALAKQIATSIYQFEAGAFDVIALTNSSKTLSFDEGQTQMYREVRRARQFDRPVSLVVLQPTDASLQTSVNRLIEETQMAMVKKYTDSRIGKLLFDETTDCDIVACRDDHFVLMLTEADETRVTKIIEGIRSRAEETLGLQFRAGSAVFPGDQVTFTGLLEHATEAMERDGGEVREEVNGQRHHAPQPNVAPFPFPLASHNNLQSDGPSLASQQAKGDG